MNRNVSRRSFWREMMQGFSTLQRLQWQAPWKGQKDVLTDRSVIPA